MIEALAAHAPEKSLGHGAHERRLNRSAHDARPGALGDTVEHRTELVVAVSDEKPRPLPEGRRVAQQLGGPLSGGSARHTTWTTRLAFTSTMKNAKTGRNQTSWVAGKGRPRWCGFERKVDQLCPRRGEGGRAPRMYRWTVRFATRTPSFNSSPRIRSAPHRRFSIAMRWLRAMTSEQCAAGASRPNGTSTSSYGCWYVTYHQPEAPKPLAASPRRSQHRTSSRRASRRPAGHRCPNRRRGLRSRSTSPGRRRPRRRRWVAGGCRTGGNRCRRRRWRRRQRRCCCVEVVGGQGAREVATGGGHIPVGAAADPHAIPPSAGGSTQ